MQIVFDTNILIDYLNGIPEAKDEVLRFEKGCISRLTWMEVLVGASKQEEALIRGFLDQFRILEMDLSVCEKAIQLRASLKLKMPDALVLASAHVLGCQLSTRNTKDYDSKSHWIRVPYAL